MKSINLLRKSPGELKVHHGDGTVYAENTQGSCDW